MLPQHNSSQRSAEARGQTADGAQLGLLQGLPDHVLGALKATPPTSQAGPQFSRASVVFAGRQAEVLCTPCRLHSEPLQQGQPAHPAKVLPGPPRVEVGLQVVPRCSLTGSPGKHPPSGLRSQAVPTLARTWRETLKEHQGQDRGNPPLRTPHKVPRDQP